MSNWTEQQLAAIDKADDLKIAPYRDDGVTTGTPTWIWEVVVDGALYVRAYNGTASRWYQSAVKQQKGEIVAAGNTYKVAFELIKDEALLDKIDDAYRSKYASSPYLSPMISERAKAATVKITLAD